MNHEEQQHQISEDQHQVAVVAAKTVVAPTTDILRQVRNLVIFFFVITLAVNIAGDIATVSANTSRAKVVHHIDANTAETERAAAAAATAAADAKTAALKAAQDLDAALAKAGSNPQSPQLTKAYAEIDCIAKGHVPCP